VLTEEQHERLAQVEAGTPMGNLLRRYWHPVGAVAELEAEPVQPVRILGEDLTLFRIPQGPGARGQGTEARPSHLPTPNPRPPTPVRYGLIAERCAHRGISLAYGVPQPNGLRCAYHGWTYDPQGRVVDMPFEPACLPLAVKAYPLQVLGGLVFAYLGPQPAPLLPRYDLFVRPDIDRSVEILVLPCSWLQCMDNSVDPVHFEHLHAVFGNYVLKKLGRPPAMNAARHLRIAFDVFEYGIIKRRLVEGEPEDCDDWQIGHPLLFPNILSVGDVRRPNYQIRVPIDATHTLHVRYQGMVRSDGAAPREAVPTRRLKWFNENGSMIGPADDIPRQDMLSWVAQGPVSNRTAEHLVTSDQGVALYHSLLFEQMEKVERGEDPMAVVRDPAKNEPMIELPRERRGYQAFWTIDGVYREPDRSTYRGGALATG
jgi:5,5'-dehydrodivanillate O-demethylase